MKTPPSHFDLLGGEPILRPLINQFVDRMFNDTMIGFLFRRADCVRVKAMEYEHAAHHLGAGTPYTGRSLESAHRPHRIAGGQFERRYTLLKDLLVECGVPEEVRKSWLGEVTRLRPQITGDTHGECSIGLPNMSPPSVSPSQSKTSASRASLPLRISTDSTGKK